MARINPILLARSRALLEHHAASESKDSKYVLKVPYPGNLRGSTCFLSYEFDVYKGFVEVRWDQEAETTIIELQVSPLHGSVHPDTVLAYAGMLVKMGNLLRQLKEL